MVFSMSLAALALAAGGVQPVSGESVTGTLAFPRPQQMSIRAGEHDRLALALGFDGKCSGGGLGELWMSFVPANEPLKVRGGVFSGRLTGATRVNASRTASFTWRVSGRFTGHRSGRRRSPARRSSRKAGGSSRAARSPSRRAPGSRTPRGEDSRAPPRRRMTDDRVTLLLVEDDPVVRTFLADNLTADGYELLVADTRARRAARARVQAAGPRGDRPAAPGRLGAGPDPARARGGRGRLAAGPDAPARDALRLRRRSGPRARVRAAAPTTTSAKPFGYGELRLRIAAVLRRTHERVHRGRLRVGELEIDPASRVDDAARAAGRAGGEGVRAAADARLGRRRACSRRRSCCATCGASASHGSTRTLDSHACRAAPEARARRRSLRRQRVGRRLPARRRPGAGAGVMTPELSPPSAGARRALLGAAAPPHAPAARAGRAREPRAARAAVRGAARPRTLGGRAGRASRRSTSSSPAPAARSTTSRPRRPGPARRSDRELVDLAALARELRAGLDARSRPPTGRRCGWSRTLAPRRPSPRGGTCARCPWRRAAPRRRRSPDGRTAASRCWPVLPARVGGGRRRRTRGSRGTLQAGSSTPPTVVFADPLRIAQACRQPRRQRGRARRRRGPRARPGEPATGCGSRSPTTGRGCPRRVAALTAAARGADRPPRPRARDRGGDRRAPRRPALAPRPPTAGARLVLEMPSPRRSRVTRRRRAALLLGLALVLGDARGDARGAARKRALEAQLGRSARSSSRARSCPPGTRSRSRDLGVRRLPARYAPPGEPAFAARARRPPARGAGPAGRRRRAATCSQRARSTPEAADRPRRSARSRSSRPARRRRVVRRPRRRARHDRPPRRRAGDAARARGRRGARRARAAATRRTAKAPARHAPRCGSRRPGGLPRGRPALRARRPPARPRARRPPPRRRARRRRRPRTGDRPVHFVCWITCPVRSLGRSGQRWSSSAWSSR